MVLNGEASRIEGGYFRDDADIFVNWVEGLIKNEDVMKEEV